VSGRIVGGDEEMRSTSAKMTRRSRRAALRQRRGRARLDESAHRFDIRSALAGARCPKERATMLSVAHAGERAGRSLQIGLPRASSLGADTRGSRRRRPLCRT